MKITFLGTGTSQGIPVIGCDCEVCLSDDPRDSRLRTSALITIDDQQLLIDAGPDFRQQMLANQVQELHGILLTHEHNDHIIGVDDVRPFNFKYRRDMPVYCTEQVAQSLKKRFAYAFEAEPYPGAPRFSLQIIDGEVPFTVDRTEVIPIPVMHASLPVLGFRFGDFTYLTDVKDISEASMQKLLGTKTLVISALRKEKHHSHLSLEEALAMIKIIQPERAFLVHLSHRMGLTEEVSHLLPANVTIAYDGLVVEF